jgi:hypothetical protein
MTEPLRLVALDSEDLAILSAKFQDAGVRVGDMAYLPRSKRFALVAARFDWAGFEAGRTDRCSSGLHFERVLRVARQGFDQAATDQVLNLLSIGFEASEPPAGRVILTFSGGAALLLEVECLEAQMRDLGDRWPAEDLPGHLLDEAVADAVPAKPNPGGG